HGTDSPSMVPERPFAQAQATVRPPAPAQIAQKQATRLPVRSAPMVPVQGHSAEPFMDEDYGTAITPTRGGWLDVDHAAQPRSGGVDYDDGFDAPQDSQPPSTTLTQPPAQSPRTIPPLDPVPAMADAGMARPPADAPSIAVPATDDALLAQVIADGAGGRYDAMNLDGGFRGRLGVTSPYYQRAHDGLRLGPHQAMQDSGELGELLGLMQRADPATFAGIFGQADALMAMVTAQGPSGLDVPGGRGPRVQPLEGADLWQDPWIDRFRMAARHPAFQAAMRAQILMRRFDPLRPVVQATGLTSARGLAMLMALGIHLGSAGAVAHLRAAANPFDTPARLGAALDALGFADLAQFCGAHGLPAVDMVDDTTHFALIAALRALGPQSPVQVPDAEALMDAMVTSAGPGALGDALLRLRLSEAFGNPEGRG
ncbi:MAG: hypothetical protein ACRCS3_12230, partial [Paracoccaceae bacterium]